MNKNIIKGKSNKHLNKYYVQNFDALESFTAQAENLNNINLIEKDIKSLYKWEHLFNNYRPISCYTTIRNDKSKENEAKDNKNEEFKSPILLVDLPENQMNLYFGKNNYESSRNKNIMNISKEKTNSNHNNNTIFEKSKTNNNISHNIRPMSMYSPRIQDSCYYFSSTFSDYYKEDFKSFCNKMPILKAKLRINSDKLKKEIELHDKTNIMKERILNKIIAKERVLLDKQDLIIAAQRRNPQPLLKSIFKQNYPGKEFYNENPKKYLNTMKPYGNDYGNVDYQKNDRWKLSNEIIKMRKNNKNEDFKNNNIKKNKRKKKSKLFLSYYDVNDPLIAIFKNKVKVEKIEKIPNKKESNNNINSESKIYKNAKTQNFNINIENINNNNDIIEYKKTESNIESSTERRKVNLKSKSSNVKKDEKSKKINKKTNNNNNSITSPTLKNLGIKDDTLYTDYLSSNCFPLKTSSDVGNTSYNKINKFIGEKKILNKLKLDYSLTQSKTTRKSISRFNFTEKWNSNSKNNNKNGGNKNNKKSDLSLILATKKIKPKKNVSLYKIAITDDKKNNNNNNNNSIFKEYTHWDKEGNLINEQNPKVNYFYFNNYIETVFNKDLMNFKKNEDNQYFFPMNAYNKLAGKYYYHNIEKKKKDVKQNNDIQNLFDNSKEEKDNNELIDNEKNTEEKKDNDYIYDQLINSSQKN